MVSAERYPREVRKLNNGSVSFVIPSRARDPGSLATSENPDSSLREE
jgi:hypothetical protein